MRYILLTIMSVMVLSAQGLGWMESYDKAVEKAKAEHKNIYVFIYADHCPYCEQMYGDVLDTKYIDYALKEFIPLKLKITSSDVKKHFPNAYVTPTSYFITPQNQLLEEALGYTTEEFFFWKIDAAEAQSKKIDIVK